MMSQSAQQLLILNLNNWALHYWPDIEAAAHWFSQSSHPLVSTKR
jgi:hypothetical protein